jgi:hypothetical protein
VLDLIGGETATRSFAFLKKGVVMVSTVGGANAESVARADSDHHKRKPRGTNPTRQLSPGPPRVPSN